MKRYFIFFLLILSVFVVCVAAHCDSIKAEFALNKTTVNPTLSNTMTSMEESVDTVSVSVPSNDIKPYHRLALKTNLLYDAALLPNIEVEWLIKRTWSLSLEGGVAWWGKYANERSYRLAMISPEAKLWIRPRAPWHGFYVGIFAGCGLYDLEKGRPGYRGEGVMGGVSGGFMWPVSRCLSLEAAIGVGYMFTRYKEYLPVNGHHVYQRTKEIHYFGPLKVKFSLVWRLWDINKPKRQNAVKPDNKI